MKFLFDDEEFFFETLRTTGFAAYGGADLGEVLTTARHIGEGDEASWHQAMFDWLDATLGVSSENGKWEVAASSPSLAN